MMTVQQRLQQGLSWGKVFTNTDLHHTETQFIFEHLASLVKLNPKTPPHHLFYPVQCSEGE